VTDIRNGVREVKNLSFVGFLEQERFIAKVAMENRTSLRS